MDKKIGLYGETNRRLMQEQKRNLLFQLATCSPDQRDDIQYRLKNLQRDIDNDLEALRHDKDIRWG